MLGVTTQLCLEFSSKGQHMLRHALNIPVCALAKTKAGIVSENKDGQQGVTLKEKLWI